MCKFLGSLSRLRWRREESCGSLVEAQASAQVDVPTAPFLSLAVRAKESKTYVRVFPDNAWICARSTIDHDLISVILEKKEREKDKKIKCNSVIVVFFLQT